MMIKTVGELRVFIERVEWLEQEKSDLGADIKEVYSEAKGVGFDIKILRRVIALRKLDAVDRAEQEALLATYMVALGMVPAEDDEATKGCGGHYAA